MTPAERQDAAVQVLILLEPKIAHSDKCPAHKTPSACNCHLIRNARTRAAALDDAGFLCGPRMR